MHGKKYREVQDVLEQKRDADEDPIQEEVMEKVRRMYKKHSSGVSTQKIKSRKLP